MMVPPDQLPEQAPQNPLIKGMSPTHMLMALAEMRQQGKLNGQDTTAKRPRLPPSPKR